MTPIFLLFPIYIKFLPLHCTQIHLFKDIILSLKISSNSFFSFSFFSLLVGVSNALQPSCCNSNCVSFWFERWVLLQGTFWIRILIDWLSLLMSTLVNYSGKLFWVFVVLFVSLVDFFLVDLASWVFFYFV